MTRHPVIVAEPNLGRAWARTLLAVAAQPNRKAFHTITSITDVTSPDLAVRQVVDQLLVERHLAGVETVTNTLSRWRWPPPNQIPSCSVRDTCGCCRG